jgi:hypothetical protein
MSTVRRLGDLLHRLTHRVPAVPAHVEQPTGHQGRANPRRGLRLPAGHPSANRHHSPARPPRVLAAWQRRIGALFGQQP